MIRKIILVTLVTFIAIITFNTLTFTYDRPATIASSPLPSLTDTRKIVDNLAQALRFKTISTMAKKQVNADEFKRFHLFLATTFPLVHRKLSLTKINQHSLLYKWQGQNKALKPMLLMAHQDVVPAENTEQWQFPPFSGHVTDTTVWGRGALDIKSGLMGSLEAVESLLASGFKPQRTLYLAYGHDEEIGGNHGAKAIATYLEQQSVNLEYVLDEGGSILEQGIIPGISSPVAVIGIAEKGYLSLQLAVKATGGHSSMPPQHSALGILSQAIVSIEANPLPADMQFSAEMFRNIGPKMPLLKRIIFANMWLTEPLVMQILSSSPTTNATIRTTAAVTMAQGSVKDNILPTLATAVINFRLMPNQTIESLIKAINHIIDDQRVVVSSLNNFQLGSQISPVNSLGFKLISKSIAQIATSPDLVITPYLVVGATDARHYSKLTTNIYRFVFNRYHPASLKQMHGIDEQIEIKDYLDSINFYQQLIINSQQGLV